MRKDVKPISSRDGLVVQDLDGEILIYDLREHKAFCLNKTSALVWQACDSEKIVAEIGRELGKRLNSPANDDLVWLALDQLKKENLIESKEEDFQIDFNGMSRREVIRKVGLASVVALPIISSLVAPTAASAQSRTSGSSQTCNTTAPLGTNQAAGCPCNGNGNCASNVCSVTSGASQGVCA